MLRFLSCVAAVAWAAPSAPPGYHRPHAAAPIEPRTPLQPCFSVFRLANDTPPTEFRHVAGSWGLHFSPYYGRSAAGWWNLGAGESTAEECVFVLEGPASYQLSLQLHDVSIPQVQSGQAANCSVGTPAVRVYNYTSLGELALAAELCLSTERGQLLSLATNTAVVTTTLTSGRFDLLASVAPTSPPTTPTSTRAPATTRPTPASTQPPAAQAVLAGGDYDQDGGEAGGSGEQPSALAPAYDEVDDLNMVDADLLHEDSPEESPPRISAARGTQSVSKGHG